MIKFKHNKKKIPKRVVLLGSSGIICENLIKVLKKNKINFKSISSKKINLKKEDSFKKIKKILKKNDVVIFLAAEAPVRNFKTLLNNIDMLNSVIEGINLKIISQLIYLSSDAVYTDSKSKINEKSKTLPSNFHGMMHIIREKILEKKFSNKLLILRPTMIYGIHDTHNGYGPNQFLRLINAEKNIVLFGKGEERRDHIYINNVVSIIIESILKKAVGVLNLASGSVYSFYDIAKESIKLTNSKIKIKTTKRKGPMPHNGYRPFDISLLKRKFKTIKIYKLKEGLKDYLQCRP